VRYIRVLLKNLYSGKKKSLKCAGWNSVGNMPNLGKAEPIDVHLQPITSHCT